MKYGAIFIIGYFLELVAKFNYSVCIKVLQTYLLTYSTLCQDRGRDGGGGLLYKNIFPGLKIHIAVMNLIYLAPWLRTCFKHYKQCKITQGLGERGPSAPPLMILPLPWNFWCFYFLPPGETATVDVTKVYQSPAMAWVWRMQIFHFSVGPGSFLFIALNQDPSIDGSINKCYYGLIKVCSVLLVLYVRYV